MNDQGNVRWWYDRTAIGVVVVITLPNGEIIRELLNGKDIAYAALKKAGRTDVVFGSVEKETTIEAPL